MAQLPNGSSLLNTHILSELKNARIALVVTDWNNDIVAEQLKGCRRIFTENSVRELSLTTVPGSFEIPFACKKLWDYYASKTLEEQPEAIIAFGAVIRGGTPHFEYVCKAVTEGITQLNLALPIPIIFGVLTVDNNLQAWERLGGIHGHKGEEAAIAALKMIHFSRKHT
jgi:6,7-dimethyl-8-ribityllumazine synthase